MPVGVKKNGTLMKGYKYKKGGAVVKAKAATKVKKNQPLKRRLQKKK